MRFRSMLIGFALGGATMLLAANALAPQDTQPRQEPPGEMDPAMRQMMEQMEKYGAPAKEHALLATYQGTWNVDGAFWEMPDQPPMKMSGESTMTMIMDGRFLFQEYDSEFMGQPYKGSGVTGYDRIKNRYVSVWIDNMSTGLMISDGKAKNADHSVIEYTGPVPDVMQGKYVPSRTVERRVSDDKLVIEMYMPGPDGKEMKTMELVYTRAEDG